MPGAVTEDCVPPGWKVEVRQRISGRRDKYYTDPESGYIFRSLKDIDRYLLTGKLGKNVSKANAKKAHCSEVKVDSMESSGESAEKKILVYGRSKKSVDLRRKLAGNGPKKDVLVAGNETKREVAEAISENKKVTGTKNEKKKEFPGARYETRKKGTGGKKEPKKGVAGAQTESRMERVSRNETKEEGTKGKSETKKATGVQNETEKGSYRGKAQRMMEVNRARNGTNYEVSLGKRDREEADGTISETNNDDITRKNDTKDVTRTGNQTKREGSMDKDSTKEMRGTRKETKKQGDTGYSAAKTEGTRHKNETMQEVGGAKSKRNKELVRARTETKEECTGSRKVKRKKLSEVQDMKISHAMWNEESSPFFMHDTDQWGADPTLSMEDISEIMDAVQKQGDTSNAPYLSAPAIGELLIRQSAETKNESTTTNPPFSTNIHHPNFPLTSTWPVKQERDLRPIGQDPACAFELNDFGYKSSGRKIQADSNAAYNCPPTIVKYENQAVENGLPQDSQLIPDVGDVWLDPCIDFAIKTLTGTDPAIETYLLQQQQQQPSSAKPERVSYYFQQQEQQPSSSKPERISYYFQPQQPNSSNLEMVSYCYGSSEQPQPISNVEELRFDNLAIDDRSQSKYSPDPSGSIPRVK